MRGTVIHQGHVVVNGSPKPASLHMDAGMLSLIVTEGGGLEVLHGPTNIPCALFTSSTIVATLLDIRYRSAQSKLGVSSVVTYSVRFAIEGVDVTDDPKSKSRRWKAFIDDAHKVHFVTGLNYSFQFLGEGNLTRIYHDLQYQLPDTAEVHCAESSVTLKFAQEANIDPDIQSGPKFKLSYPILIEFNDEVEIDFALQTIIRISELFSLIVGEISYVRGCEVYLDDGERPQFYKVIGASESTPEKLIKPSGPPLFDLPVVGKLADKWLVRYPNIKDAASLHMDAIRNRELPPEIVFQMFIQAIELLHREKNPAKTKIFDQSEFESAVAGVSGMDKITLKRIIGISKFLNEPGLRKRVLDCFKILGDQLLLLRPEAKNSRSRAALSDRIVSTRNYFAHRGTKEEKVFEGVDLFNAIELLKFISYCSLLHEIGAPVEGLAQRLLDKGFLNKWQKS